MELAHGRVQWLVLVLAILNPCFLLPDSQSVRNNPLTRRWWKERRGRVMLVNFMCYLGVFGLRHRKLKKIGGGGTGQNHFKSTRKHPLITAARSTDVPRHATTFLP